MLKCTVRITVLLVIQCFLYVDFVVASRHGKISAATVSEIGLTHNVVAVAFLNDPSDLIRPR